LDPMRKGSVVRFLYESGLIARNHPTLDLSGADLSGADLSEADLSGAEGFSNEELDQQAASLEGATMPNGQKYDDWVLPPGEFSTYEFEPAFLIEVGEDWSFGAPEMPDQVLMQRGLVGQLRFTNPSDVFDPSNLSEQKKLPAPENAEEWVSWLQSHPNLQTSKPVSVSVGGASGMRIDVTTSSMPENYPRKFCGERPCVPLYPLSDDRGIIGNEGSKYRFVIVDVEGKTVVIDVTSPQDIDFDAFSPEAQKVLDTVEWRNG
jgi:hypothetical protein